MTDSPLDPALAAEEYCYLTTIGRVTGRPHEIEIWFVLIGRRVYLMAGNHRSDWVLNLRRRPYVTLRIGSTTYDATATVVIDSEEDARVRPLMLAKYRHSDSDLADWGRRALVVAVDLT